MYSYLQPVQTQRQRPSMKWLLVPLIILVVAGGYVFWALQRSLPAVMAPADKQLTSQTGGSILSWPGSTQAAVGIVGTNILETNGSQTPAPTASTAKIITALLILNKHPLKLGEQGQTLTITDDDVALYKAYAAKGGSTVPVQTGEKITEYQMLEAIMLPSANNIADTAALWAYGAPGAYKQAAQAFVAKAGLNNTTIGGDASGLDPTTASTAHDLVKIGELAMQNPVLSQIVGQKSATGIPMTNSVRNVNSLLGNSGVVGIKTGNSDQAGGVFVGAAKTTINGKSLTIVTAIVGASSLTASMQNSLPLIQSAEKNFTLAHLFKAHEVLGHYQVPWGGQIAVTATNDFFVNAWRGSSVKATVHFDNLPASALTGQPTAHIRDIKNAIGNTSLNASLRTNSAVKKPSTFWRLTHPF